METTTKTRETRPGKKPGPAPDGYHLTPATEEAVHRRAEAIGVPAPVVVEIAVAQWIQQQG